MAGLPAGWPLVAVAEGQASAEEGAVAGLDFEEYCTETAFAVEYSVVVGSAPVVGAVPGIVDAAEGIAVAVESIASAKR